MKRDFIDFTMSPHCAHQNGSNKLFFKISIRIVIAKSPVGVTTWVYNVTRYKTNQLLNERWKHGCSFHSLLWLPHIETQTAVWSVKIHDNELMVKKEFEFSVAYFRCNVKYYKNMRSTPWKCAISIKFYVASIDYLLVLTGDRWKTKQCSHEVWFSKSHFSRVTNRHTHRFYGLLLWCLCLMNENAKQIMVFFNISSRTKWVH